MSTLRETATRFGPRWQTVASALLVAASFPPWDLYPLVFVALIPFLFRIAGSAGLWEAVAQGFWLSFGLGVFVAPWLATGVHEFLGVPWVLAVAVWLLFAATCAAPHLLGFAALMQWSSADRGLIACVGLAAGYVALSTLAPGLFDVGLGYALHSNAWMRQAAELGGVPLLTFAIVLVNSLLFQAIVAGSGDRGRMAGRVAAALATVALLLGHGALRTSTLESSRASSEQVLRAVLVQGNVANETRLAWARGDDRAAERQLSAYTIPTEALVDATPRPDLVVWPEATFPGVFRKPTSTAQQGRGVKFDRMVLRLDVPIVFGAYDVVEGEAATTLFNSLLSITPNYERRGAQGFVQTYRKHDLLAFAETLPLVGESQWLRRLLPSFGSFGRGPGPVVLHVTGRDGKRVDYGPLICSEAINPDNAVGGVRNGSEMILNVGSDGWFGSAGEAEFHLAISRFRSIETRRPQLRAANTGISALILPSGEIAARTRVGEATTLEVEVPIVERPDTLRVVWGDWVGPAAMVVAVAFLFLEWRSRRTG